MNPNPTLADVIRHIPGPRDIPCIPEPSTLTLVVVGLVLLSVAYIVRRGFRARKAPTHIFDLY
jgi:hypothetical protein